jgi:hypothetical protein
VTTLIINRLKRGVVSFGWRYNFNGSGLQEAAEIPDFLLPVRDRAAAFADLAPAALEHVLVIEYPPGAGIGWHKDRPVFGDVIGISLLASCTFRLRRKRGPKWERRSFMAEPRVPFICFAGLRDMNGSTASHPSKHCAIPSHFALFHAAFGLNR